VSELPPSRLREVADAYEILAGAYATDAGVAQVDRVWAWCDEACRRILAGDLPNPPEMAMMDDTVAQIETVLCLR